MHSAFRSNALEQSAHWARLAPLRLVTGASPLASFPPPTLPPLPLLQVSPFGSLIGAEEKVSPLSNYKSCQGDLGDSVAPFCLFVALILSPAMALAVGLGRVTAMWRGLGLAGPDETPQERSRASFRLNLANTVPPPCVAPVEMRQAAHERHRGRGDAELAVSSLPGCPSGGGKQDECQKVRMGPKTGPEPKGLRVPRGAPEQEGGQCDVAQQGMRGQGEHRRGVKRLGNAADLQQNQAGQNMDSCSAFVHDPLYRNGPL